MLVTDIIDHGTIVTVVLGGTERVNLDHRMFHHFAQDYDYDFRDIEFDTDGSSIWESSGGRRARGRPR